MKSDWNVYERKIKIKKEKIWMKPPCDSCINSRDNFFAFAASNTPGTTGFSQPRTYKPEN